MWWQKVILFPVFCIINTFLYYGFLNSTLIKMTRIEMLINLTIREIYKIILTGKSLQKINFLYVWLFSYNTEISLLVRRKYFYKVERQSTSSVKYWSSLWKYAYVNRFRNLSRLSEDSCIEDSCIAYLLS